MEVFSGMSEFANLRGSSAMSPFTPSQHNEFHWYWAVYCTVVLLYG